MVIQSSTRSDPLADAPDHVLVDLARQKTPFAIDVLIDRHYSPVQRFLTRQTRDPDFAQDLTQEVFATAFERLAQLNDAAAFLPWLYRIARNQCHSSYRRTTRLISIDVIGWIDMATSSRMKPIAAQGRSIVDIAEADVIQQVLDRLRPDHRELLLLRHLAGFTLDEVAAIINRSPQTTQRRINRAEASFRNHHATIEAPQDRWQAV